MKKPIHPDLASDHKEYIGLTLVTIVVAAAIFALVTIGIKYVLPQIPDHIEKKIKISLAADSVPPESKADFIRAETLLKQLLAFQDRRDLEFSLHYLNQTAPNAAAVPGGGVYVTSGLLNLIKTEGGLAFVLAHEIGHHQLRHTMKALATRFALPLAMTLLVGSTPFSSVTSILMLKHSRSDELAADAFAHQLVKQKLKHTDGITEFFEKIQTIDPLHTHVPEIFLTHPYPQERLDVLKKLR